MKTKPHYLVRSSREIHGQPRNIGAARALVRRLGPANDFYVERVDRRGKRTTVFNNCLGINLLKVFPFNWTPYAKEASGNLGLLSELRAAKPDKVAHVSYEDEEEALLRALLNYPGDIKIAIVHHSNG